MGVDTTCHMPQKAADFGNKESAECRRFRPAVIFALPPQLPRLWWAASSFFPPSVARGCWCWCCVCRRVGAGAASVAAWVLVLGASFGGPRAGDGGVVCRTGCVVYVVRVAEEDGPRVRHGQLHSLLRECVVCQMQHQHPVSTSGKRQQVPGGAM